MPRGSQFLARGASQSHRATASATASGTGLKRIGHTGLAAPLRSRQASARTPMLWRTLARPQDRERMNSRSFAPLRISPIRLRSGQALRTPARLAPTLTPAKRLKLSKIVAQDSLRSPSTKDRGWAHARVRSPWGDCPHLCEQNQNYMLGTVWEEDSVTSTSS